MILKAFSASSLKGAVRQQTENTTLRKRGIGQGPEAERETDGRRQEVKGKYRKVFIQGLSCGRYPATWFTYTNSFTSKAQWRGPNYYPVLEEGTQAQRG